MSNKQKAPKRVRITGCSFEQGWYRNRIGEEYNVDNAGSVKDYVVWQDYIGKATTWRHIAKSDCVVVVEEVPAPHTGETPQKVVDFAWTDELVKKFVLQEANKYNVFDIGGLDIWIEKFKKQIYDER